MRSSLDGIYKWGVYMCVCVAFKYSCSLSLPTYLGSGAVQRPNKILFFFFFKYLKCAGCKSLFWCSILNGPWMLCMKIGTLNVFSLNFRLRQLTKWRFWVSTKVTRKASTGEQHKLAVTDHVAQANHIIDWEKARILDRDANPFSRKIRESIGILKKGPWQSTAMKASLL